ncbi:BTB domain-containing protein [Mycena sanguinolenta]|uniref:BTB domain-containing protein n=1 Tax=Mycena sanguinolenta TaxID=230812 RepID=A0A8H6YMA6_9AGAR|nr:BTB domain-containing protein [Mycena sanguinolenta]
MSFGEYSLPTDTLAAILGAYPFSVGLFRELLQNSDDARATKQVFVLDARSHGTETLIDPKLAATQGPSLLAYNDSLFSDSDWDALQSIHRSSKKEDTSKIGKYGIGFRSCYHVTDNPQVLSGPSLAILDPHHHFAESGGIKLDFVPKAAEYSNQLDAFEFFLSPNIRHRDFPGSVIRLPLRKPGTQSSISSKAVDATEIRQLFDDFVREEIGISLLFLKNITSIEVHEVDAQGGRKCLAKSSIQKGEVVAWGADGDRHTSFKCAVAVETPLLGRVERAWRIVHSYFPPSNSTSLLSLRLGQDPRPTLAKHKLLSEMAIAIPMSILSQEESSGRLFTYLPLPLKTGFPCHVHGLFALTQSRQNLNNGGEIGIVRGSEDSVLVEWNHILFDTFLPRTWAALLHVLLQEDQLKDVFRAWPPRQSEVFGGDNAYWQALPAKLLAYIVIFKAETWGSLLVASADVDDATLQALANAGLRVTQLPRYIVELLSTIGPTSAQHYTLLSPSIAYLGLSSQVREIQAMDAADRTALLEYLLQTKRLEYLLGLPIVPLVNGFMAPVRRGAAPDHTMLSQAEYDVFKTLDESAVSLPSIPAHLQDLFRESSTVNISILSPEKVVSYLQSSPLGCDLSHRHEGKLDDAVVAWLTAFWAWLGTWSARDLLFPQIHTLCVVPTRTGLESPEVGVFSDLGADSVLVSIFRRLGLAFLHPILGGCAQRSRALPNLQLEKDEAYTLSKHVIDCVLQTCQQRPLDENQRHKLRSLPIFPLLTPSVNVIPEKSPRALSGFRLPSLHKKSKSVSLPNLECVDEGVTILGIPSGTIAPLPVATGVVYLDGANINLALLPQLAPSNANPLSSADILALALEYFSLQSKSMQAKFLDFMVQNHNTLPPALSKSLQTVAFIPVLDGTLQSPAHVIDPARPELVAIYSESKDRIPTMQADDAPILRHLRSLKLLTATLTVDLVAERVQFISSRSALTESRLLTTQLLSMLYTSSLDCTSLEIPLEAKWLPTATGLVGRGECLDAASQPELFDEVVPVLDRDVKLSQSLRTALGWDHPIPMSILLGQLRAIIRGGHASTLKLECLIKEFSGRTLSEADLAELTSITTGRPWIPIASNRLASTNYAVFASTFGLAGFYQIPFSLADQPPVRSFLLRMGCTERPVPAILVNELKTLEKKSPTQDIAEQAISILAVLAEDLKSVNRKDLLVPDSNTVLRPIGEILFNDVGDRACLIDPGKRHLAHPRLSETLAKLLLMDRLGFQAVELTPGIDMGESLVTTIRNVLKQYSELQICNEFLANACDAEATKFGICVDEKPGLTNKLLSSAMVPFQTCPSLVMYNNGVFSSKDFEGICRTGIGGKEGRTNTIGQFGLGALSMFHFTEMAMIVSGAHVLFLDPSKTHLPIQGRASLLLPLEQIKRWYPDHLTCLDGLYDFHADSVSHYNGTLFRLPLRNSSHISPHSILSTARITPQHIRERILKPFCDSSKHALIFTKLESIVAFGRDSTGKQSRGWAISATRNPPEQIINFRTQLVHIKAGGVTEDFKVVSVSYPLSQLPSELTPLVGPHRLRSPIVVGLAAPLTPSNANHNLFSVVQLPISTTLPVHLTASFILSPDRRSIRLDDIATAESKYNRWLLSDVAPGLYLFLLGDLIRTHPTLGNESWWPGNTTQQDNASKQLVDSFYSTHLPTTKQRVCFSEFEAEQFRPSDVILGGNEPAPVSKILSLLGTHHIVRLPAKVRERCIEHDAMKSVDQAFVKLEIKQKTTRLRSLFDKGEVTTRDIQTLVNFLAEDDKIDTTGLPLLPLADGKLAVLEKQSSGSNYYVWKPAYPERTLFRSEFLIDPEFVADKFLDKGLNVTKFTTTALEKLVKEHFPDGAEKSGMKEDQQAWVKLFWAEYPHFGLSTEGNISNSPLVRTNRPGHYVSLGRCYTNHVLLVSNSEPLWLCNLLSELGASVVQRDHKELSKALREILKRYPPFSFERVLGFFQTIQSSIPKSFAKLDPAIRAQFADWTRGQITRTPEGLIPVASALPIWKEATTGTLQAASKLKMLPFGISREIALRFLGVPATEHNSALVHLKVVPMDFNQFWSHLKLPTTLAVEEQSAYKQLLTHLPPSVFYGTTNILVPNGNRTLVKADTLYTRHALFVAAFGSDTSPTHFILDIFRDLEPRLVSIGLKSHTNLDVQTFKLCAQAIQADTAHPNISARARIVFRAYGEDMPLRIQSNESHVWRELDKIRFVPRNALRRRTMGIEESSVYVKRLPDVVSPEQVLLLENEAVAWTQRAVLLYPPEERVLVAHPSFGQPRPKEVIEHLRVLALQVAKDYTSDIYLLSDLEATYAWLEEHQHELEDSMIEFHDEPLFLNVDDPKTDPWSFNSADELFFNIRDGGDLKSVKKFLLPFKDLLTVSGVEDIVNAPVPGVELSSVETQLSVLRKGFQAMRLEGKLIDVVFISDDETRYPAHRAYLAPMSEYLQDLFTGSFTEAGPGTADEPIEIEVDYPGPCVEAILDYLYLAKPPSLERLDDLLDVMDLANYWALGELNQLVQAKIIGNNQISPATYEEVVARATALDAKLLIDACEFFERENGEAIARLRGNFKGKRSARRIPKKVPVTRLPSFAVAAASSSKPSTSSGSTLKIKSPTAKKVAKGFMKGLRKVGDTWNFIE